MLTSISPLGERGRNARWGRTVGWYVAGSVLGGAAIGGIAGLLGAALARLVPVDEPSWLALVVLAVGAAVGAWADVRHRGRHLPGPSRQVDEDWLARYRPWVYGGGFGLQLGLGVATIVTSASVYVAWFAALLTGSPLGGLAVGASFGLARALPVLRLRRVVSAPALATLHRRLATAEPRAAWATIAVLAFVAVAALGLTVLTLTSSGASA